MGLSRDVSLLTALRYRGGLPMLAYVMHRLGGIALFTFFTIYILVLAGLGFARAIFENPVFQVIILFLALFHAINGLRITILDLWPGLIEYQRQAIRLEGVILVLVYGFTVFAIARAGLGG